MIGSIIANITWNSKDWKGVSDDKSNHRWVQEGNIPHESWNFDFDNPRNTNGKILGFFQCRNVPKYAGRVPFFIAFYSDNKIVGFYANAQILSQEVTVDEQQSYNLIGDAPLCVLLKNKMDVSDKRLLFGKQRIGQVGFNNIQVEDAIEILRSAIALNPDQQDRLERIYNWLSNNIMNDYEKYKHLLEYFVTHLEYVYHGENIKTKGYEQYIEPIESFKKMGHGWKGDRIQEQIKKWETYDDGKICINISHSPSGGYTTKANYLNWEDTGINVVATWEKGHVVELRLVNYQYWEKPPVWIELNCVKSLISLGLFDGNEPNDDLKSFFDEYRAQLHHFNAETQKSQSMERYHKYVELLKAKKNLVLQGAPGTGKTYNTAAIALAVLGVSDIDYNARNQVMTEYQRWVDQKRIFFTTFHQSMDYEEFIEGLKPEIVRGEGGKSVGVTYEVKDGIFKQACQSVVSGGISTLKCLEKFIASVTGSADENAVIIKTISGKSEIKVWHVKGNQTLMVKSTVSASDNGYAPLNIEKLKLQACDDDVEPNWPAYAKAVIRASIGKYGDKKNQPVVLIIDEINRGNISKIFGELITLLEKDKRAGEENAITVTLPFSGTCFSVPSNLYIIGTMNTTDRSTGAVDYAIRRRFAFVTLKAEDTLIEEKWPDSLPLFKAVQHFIKQHTTETLDMDDLMIGHSYFMTDDLPMAWEYEIRPLLVEYYKDGLLKCLPEGDTIEEFIAKNVAGA